MRWKPSARYILVDGRTRPVDCGGSLKEERSTGHASMPISNHSEMLSRNTLRSFRATLGGYARWQIAANPGR